MQTARDSLASRNRLARFHQSRGVLYQVAARLLGGPPSPELARILGQDIEEACKVLGPQGAEPWTAVSRTLRAVGDRAPDGAQLPPRPTGADDIAEARPGWEDTADRFRPELLRKARNHAVTLAESSQRAATALWRSDLTRAAELAENQALLLHGPVGEELLAIADQLAAPPEGPPSGLDDLVCQLGNAVVQLVVHDRELLVPHFDTVP